jgi:hypothetical protein
MYKIIGADQKEYGPVSADQLRQWIAEGRVNGQTKVQAADTTEWKAMADVPEFAAVFPKMPPPPPSPVVPIRPLPTRPANSQMAVWAMITGIISLVCCCFPVAPVAIILGAVALSQLKSHPELTGGGFAIAGIVLGILAIIIFAAFFILFMVSPQYAQTFQNMIPQ